ncbi:RNA polymerase sigma-70 factor (ECF subfamily) [Agromyces hippuratus]|uniref:RNA polymerase sigma-70 factor (ECF subfamily) n=1 Tax=Agromyces hippuratus TaxID=286438 RepID=A0A852X4Q7_9MICO|nr:RNA polymerase sigma factor [Agromyces hippuratus]NYG20995.1 RNA polymerase sigma-70 factor (ECF subfamily) [Agromyces hippuratus]
MDDDARSDAVLWLEATSGTEASFGVVYDRYRARIFRKACSRVFDRTDAEDVVAIVFLEAWRRRHDVRFVDGSLLPWLLVVTTNVSLNIERSGRRYRRLLAKLPAAEHALDPSHEVGTRLDSERTARQVTAALQRLGANDRRIVDLCLVDQLPMADVANVLDIPVGTVKSRLARARAKLQAELGSLREPRETPAPSTAAPSTGTPSSDDLGMEVTR